jgi:hypothetical protein
MVRTRRSTLHPHLRPRRQPAPAAADQPRLRTNPPPRDPRRFPRPQRAGRRPPPHAPPGAGRGHDRDRSSGTFAVAAVNQHVRQVLRPTGLTRTIPIYPSVETAVVVHHAGPSRSSRQGESTPALQL